MAGLVVIGGSYAGLNIAAAARQHGYAESITMLTAEAVLPYHRPPLSKGFLTGDGDLASLLIRGEKFYADKRIEVVFGADATAVDPAGNVTTAAGRFAFDMLAVATGTRARLLPLPGHDLDGVVSLRSLADAEAIRERLATVRSVVVIGGGFVGLELAASFAKAGVAVTVIEGAARVMARVVGRTMSAFVEERLGREGVTLLCGTGVEAIDGVAGKVVGVRDSHGGRHDAGLVVVAVGAVPNTELLEPLGLTGQQGILIDPDGRTVDPRIFAAGDCAFGPNLFAGRDLRLESVQNATDQAKAAGAAIAGGRFVNDTVPWFWSDQFDLKLQMVGFNDGASHQVVRGSIEAGSFSVFYMTDDRVVGIESVNAVPDHVFGRKLLKQPHVVDAALIADTAVPLKELLIDG